STKLVQVFALFGIWGIATVSLNLINGVTGILSLGHHGFMLIGGYVTGLLMLPLAARENLAASSRSQLSDFAIGLSLEGWAQSLGLRFLTEPQGTWVLFLVALVIGGFVSALFGVIVGVPSLRLRGDYLAVVTFAFGEVIRLLASTPMMSPFTNGALGFAGVPTDFGKSVWWTFGLLAITVFIFARLKSGSYGRALQGIREDEVAAEAMGVNTSYHKVLAFAISAFFAGVAGGLWVSWVGTARLDLFLFTLTFYFLVAISAGGTGSITGALIGTALVVAVRQYGDPFEQSYPLSTWLLVAGILLVLAAVLAYFYRRNKHMRPLLHPAMSAVAIVGVVAAVLSVTGLGGELLERTWQGFGMRAIALSVLLIVIMVFRPAGVMGRQEANWSWLLRDRRDVPTDEERQQDAWLHARGEGTSTESPGDARVSEAPAERADEEG
ncbi:MAG TPA: branched-chain amino acid ABC transporter permease, partial [Trueperaceae bacterium]|nr:branched-chain amino acid ABC transporter permease [Trueperaceae bacterium]